MADYQTVIIGAGPAGATTARRLAASGISTLLLDKEPFPRYKACGGAVSRRCQKLLDLDVNHLGKGELTTVEVAFEGRTLTYTSQRPIALFVHRKEFDEYHVQEAVKSGAQFQDGVTAKELEPAGHEVVVRTSAGKLTACVVIIASGAKNTVRNTGIPSPPLGAAIEGEAPLPPTMQPGTARIEFATPESGYSWLFAKKDGLSFGTCALEKGRSPVARVYRHLVQGLGLQDGLSQSVGHPIPLASPSPFIAVERVLAVGDAAGLVDPLSGEGIAYAVNSGILAADAIVKAFTTGDFSFRAYEKTVEQNVVSQLEVATRIARIIHRWPAVFFRLLETTPTLLKVYFETVEGSVEYRELWKRFVAELGGRFKFWATPSDS